MRWWPKVTGWATCRCVKPGMRVSAWRSARSRRPTRTARAAARISSIAARSQRRMSVATWSLRERAVCRRLPASPTRSVSLASMLRWTSSRSMDQGKRPASTSPRIWARPRSIAWRSAAGITLQRSSMRAWASDASMSKGASRRSKATEALKRWARRSRGSAKRPDQAFGVPAGAGSSSCCMEAAAMAKCGAVASINQTGAGIRLPNFCNLGVMLRSLLLVNALLAAAAVIRAPSANTIWLEFLVLAAFGEPVLIASLMALCAARRFLNAIGYVGAIALLAVFELGVTSLLFEGSSSFMPVPGNMTYGQVVFVTFFVTAITLGYFDLRARALSPAVAEARIQALQARIRPHFLYNSINAVLSLIRTEPRRAERALEDLADLFRVLMAENRTLAPIAGEVELARQYLAMESLRLGDRLRVTWDTATMPADAMVPPLILQPMVENAVYHGI